MKQIVRTAFAMVSLGACIALVGCSSPPADEQKGVNPADGSKPVATGATGAGGQPAAQPSGQATSQGKATAQ